ncbi:MAG: response regulator [Bryobacteraceae bacterium]
MSGEPSTTWVELSGDSSLVADELGQLKGQFLASLNHEIRTPLSGILGMTDLLLETRLDDEQQEYVQAARLCAQNLLEILNATLEYAALSAGHLELNEYEFCLAELLDAAVAEQSIAAKTKGLRLYCTLDDSLPETLVGDAPRIRQLLSHLIANAVKFTHQGHIELSATGSRTRDGRVSLILQVADTGIGIQPDKLNVIFQSFRQIESGLSRTYPGLGLGLALSQKLASLLGGEITVESQSNCGTTLTVHLRLHAPDGGAVPPEPARENGAVKHRILVVEDNPVAQTVVRHILKKFPVHLDFASSGHEALERVRSIRYALILMDLQMPEMNGLETTSAIRELPEYQNVPVLALTANSSEEYRILCEAHGMRAFLAKPVQSSELVSTISRFLPRQ